jgi:hypothetical protein
MTGQLRFYITALPGLGSLGTAPPIGLAELLEHLSNHPKAHRLVQAIALLDDLEQREAFLAGELKEVEPAVLSIEQVKGEAALPEFLAPPVQLEETLSIPLDRLWASYFLYVLDLARGEQSDFLRQWVEFEIALRNALAVARARKLELEETGFLVLPELGRADVDLTPTVAEWAAAKTPLAALQVVIRCRWEWTERHEAWFQFTFDELLVYAVRLMLLDQWRRTSGEGKTLETER